MPKVIILNTNYMQFRPQKKKISPVDLPVRLKGSIEKAGQAFVACLHIDSHLEGPKTLRSQKKTPFRW